MPAERDEFLLVLRPGSAPTLRVFCAASACDTDVHGGEGMTIVEHRPGRRTAASAAEGLVLSAPYEACLQGVQLRWDGAVLTVLRAIESGTHVFAAFSDTCLVVGSTMAAVRERAGPEALRTDPMALLDLHFLGRVLPPFTLHRGIASLDLGMALVATSNRENLGVLLRRTDHSAARLGEALAADVCARRTETGPIDAMASHALARFDLVPLCALATGLPPGDPWELAYFAMSHEAHGPLPALRDWIAATSGPAGALRLRGERVESVWSRSALGRSFAKVQLLQHSAEWDMRRGELFARLRQVLRQPACKALTLDALFDAAVVFPDRLARASRIAVANGRERPAIGDWLPAACRLLREPATAHAAPDWADKPVERAGMLTMQQRAGCVSRFFPVSALRARVYRRALRGTQGAALSQRLTGILAAQFIEEQVVHSWTPAS